MAFYKTAVDHVEENLTYDQLINEALAAADAANRSLSHYDTADEHNVLREVLTREILATGTFEFTRHDELNAWIKKAPQRGPAVPHGHDSRMCRPRLRGRSMIPSQPTRQNGWVVFRFPTSNPGIPTAPPRLPAH